jgi:hypothetical protein
MGADGRVTGNSRRRDWWLAAALILGAGALRAWAAGTLRADLRISEPLLDGRYYLDLATSLARGRSWPAGPIFMTPLYPWLLSIVFRLVGCGVGAVQLFQSALGLATLVPLYCAARRDLGPRAAIGTAVLYVLCGPILAMESLVLTESLLLFLVAAALWAWPERHRAGWAPAVFGVTCGLLVIGRGTFLLLPAAWIAWVFRRFRLRGGASLPWRPVVLVLAGLVLTLLPLTVHQVRATGRLQVLTLNGGLNLYLGNSPAARGLYSQPAGIDLEKDITGARSLSVLTGRELSPVEADRSFAALARAFVRQQPARAGWLLGRKALLFFAPREIPQIENFEMLRQDSWPLRVAFVDFRWLLPLAVLGIAAAWSRRTRQSGWGCRVPTEGGSQAACGRRYGGQDREYLASWLTIGAIGWLSTILFFATGRYRVPFLAGFLGLAGLGVSDLAGMVRRLLDRGTARAAGSAAATVAGADAGEALPRRFPARLVLLPATVVLQLLLPSYPVAAARAFEATQLGMREARRGNTEAALRHYREALRFDPEFGEAWHGTGARRASFRRRSSHIGGLRKSCRDLQSPTTTWVRSTGGSAMMQRRWWNSARR